MKLIYKNLITIIILLFLSNEYVLSLANDNSNNFSNNENSEYKYSSKLKANYSTKYESDESIYIYLKLSKDLDSLYKKNPSEFKWKITGMPKGSVFDEETKILKWEKIFLFTGDFSLTFNLSSPYNNDSITVDFKVEEAWKAYLIPGASYTFYLPALEDTYGTFSGASFEYIIYTGIHRNENKGPSHVKIYTKFDLLFSNIDTVSEAFNFGFGLNLSFERNPTRRFLIPYFGFEMGSFYQKNVGSLLTLTPTMGIWAYTDQNILIHLNGGYVLPSTKLEELRGYKVSAGLNFSLW